MQISIPRIFQAIVLVILSVPVVFAVSLSILGFGIFLNPPEGINDQTVFAMKIVSPLSLGVNIAAFFYLLQKVKKIKD